MIQVYLFLRNDDNKVTGKHNSYKVNLEKQFGNVNLGITRMTGLKIQLYMNYLALQVGVLLVINF